MKNILSILLAFCICIVFVHCGRNTKPSNKPKSAKIDKGEKIDSPELALKKAKRVKYKANIKKYRKKLKKAKTKKAKKRYRKLIRINQKKLKALKQKKR